MVTFVDWVNRLLTRFSGIRIHRAKTGSENTWSKLLKESLANGFQDINDYIEKGADDFARKFVEGLLGIEGINFERSKILEVGAGAGRFSRDIVKYLGDEGILVALEKDEVAYGLLRQAMKENNNVVLHNGDFFDDRYSDDEFDIVLFPWFSHPSRLQLHNLIFERVSRICRKGGLFAFDFFDSTDNLAEKLSPRYELYPLINGSDLERIGSIYRFLKVRQFDVAWNNLSSRVHIYRKEPVQDV